MEEVLVEEEKQQKLKEVLKEIKKAVKKEKKEEGPIDKKVKKEEPKQKSIKQYAQQLEEPKQLNYEGLFDYLGSLKQNKYQYNSNNSGSSKTAIDPSHDLKEKTLEFVRQQKMDKIKGQNRDYEISQRSEAYFWFKLVHGKGITELLYDLSFT